MAGRLLVQLSWAALLLFAAGASQLEASPPSPWKNRPRKWMKGTAVAAEPLFCNTTAASTNNSDSSLVPRCAAPPPSIVSIHDLASASTEPPPTPEPDWLLGDDDDKTAASTTAKLLLAILLPALGGGLGFGAYKVFNPRFECFNHCCTNINCCICY